jgi:pimeloyl-ACP methyl ester carboxylesterase
MLFSPTMRDRFDIVSWDPRGIGDSTAVQCFATAEDEAAFFAGVPQLAFPVGVTQKLAWIKRFATYGGICLHRNGALLSYTSTTDTARDMELLRQSTGETTLNYIGISYGTFLGATYANLFPEHVRAMILDGNLVPSVYTNNGDPNVALSSALRFGSDQGLSRSLGAFLDQCGRAGPGSCAFSTGDARGTRRKFDFLLRRLSKTPVTIKNIQITYSVLLKSLEGRLFTTRPEPGGFPGWVGGGSLLELVFRATTAQGAPSPAVEAEPPPTNQPSPPSKTDTTYVSTWQSLTVECSDSPNPRPPLKFLALDHYAFAAYGPIGVVDLWADEPCASWPVRGADQYTGPWNHPTPHTILLIGNTYDPSTPYKNSLGMAKELANARLLTVTGYGHTVLLNPSHCAEHYEDAYLVNLTLPPKSAVCRQNKRPFD